MKAVLSWVKREWVFVCALTAATISCAFVPPDAAYAGYIDWRTLALLYALMVVVAGLRSAGVFEAMARMLCARMRSLRALGIALVYLCFFSSVLITNDVALLTFVPFAVVTLSLTGHTDALIRVIVLQTVAANLGSMLTPIGNPQNLYLYSRYGFSFGSFLRVTFPVWAMSLLLIFPLCMTLPDQKLGGVSGRPTHLRAKPLLVYLLLFTLCLLTVVRVIAWPLMLLLLVAALLCFDRPVLLRADFMLLLTFVCFFVFAGNLTRLPAVDALLRRALVGREYGVSLLCCQAISNVPAALLLCGFTDNARALLLGVNVGGLGTPIASLASLIGLKLYAQTHGHRFGRFLAVFTAVNVLLLLILSGVAMVLI